MGKILRRILIPLVIAVAAVALLDRVANAVAERRVASQVVDTAVAHGAYSDQRPEVAIRGWPFVTQAFGGEFEQIDITLRGVGAGGLDFPELGLVATGIEVDWRDLAAGTGQVTAANVTAEGTIALDSLAVLVDDMIELDANVEEDGTVRLDATVEPEPGQQVGITASGRIELAGNALRLDMGPFELVEGTLPPGGRSALEEYTSRFNTVLELPELPYGIELTEIDFSGPIVEVSGSASGVALT